MLFESTQFPNSSWYSATQALNLDGQIMVINIAGEKSLTHPFGQLKTRPMPEVEINL
jgi:hypothetical protein